MPGLLGFAPWIVYAIIATSDEWRWGAIVGLVTAVLLVVVDRVKRKNWDEMVIATSAVVFFALITVISLIDADSPLTRFGPALVNLWLAGTAWGSLAIKKPFTLGIARTMVPAEIAATDAFYRVNVVITSVWAVAFSTAAVLLTGIIAVSPQATTLVITVKIITFVAPAIFTVCYPKIVQARYSD
ncbi:hypothetical protein OIE66_41400 [Nonomuraea sp. NBC_01738]|uniref:hypothetical protein n=1 Tax=Nonomuraea sp. NBC_01738 TaxID=2976003 RepID=UPI002E128075|nr:hypothetical protein OIE66_41400 [Nonomuraea sp. NBC_01738]